MIGYIFLCILLIILFSVALLFVFCILLPSLNQQQGSDSDPVFSDEETDTVAFSPGFINSTIEKVAVVLCSSNRKFPDGNRMQYYGLKDCKFFKSIYKTENDCEMGCTGFGSCLKLCPQNAIKIINHTAVVTEMCNGCGECVEACPYHLIKMIPLNTDVIVPCILKDSEYSDCSVACKTGEACQEKYEPLRENAYHFWKKLRKFFISKQEKSISKLWE